MRELAKRIERLERVRPNKRSSMPDVIELVGVARVNGELVESDPVVIWRKPRSEAALT